MSAIIIESFDCDFSCILDDVNGGWTLQSGLHERVVLERVDMLPVLKRSFYEILD